MPNMRKIISRKNPTLKKLGRDLISVFARFFNFLN